MMVTILRILKFMMLVTKTFEIKRYVFVTFQQLLPYLSLRNLNKNEKV